MRRALINSKMTTLKASGHTIPKGIKRSSSSSLAMNENGRPEKRARVLLSEDSDGDSSANGSKTGLTDDSKVSASNYVLAVNEDFARRFEHNKKREELQQRMYIILFWIEPLADATEVEEKYGVQSIKPKVRSGGAGADEGADDLSDSSTDSEEEDDDGFFISDELDAQIQATLNAIRTKDPRVYDGKTRFYTAEEESQLHDPTISAEPKAKPMYLRDFHRINLLQGDAGVDKQEEVPPTYAEQQDNLRHTLVKEMHAAAHDNSTGSAQAEEANSDEDDFLVKKLPPSGKAISDGDPMAHAGGLDPKIAEKDPEGFLSTFMSARAWIPSVGSKFQPFDSDSEDDDRRAEAFEEAYNLRFEDPKGSNEKLLSHARDAAARYSVRKETTKGRKKIRDAERAKKEAEKSERRIEKARLRKLKISEAEEKIKRIKDAAGLRGNTMEGQDWSALLSENWDNERWEEEMKNKFGDEYYADHDISAVQEGNEGVRKIKKPKWQDEIEITDLIPGFEHEEEILKPQFSLTDEDSGDEMVDQSGDASTQRIQGSGQRSKDVRKRKETLKREARKERRKIEQIVDENLAVDDRLSEFVSKSVAPFRYRETSPITYGLTPNDILMASDSQLNQFVGLKKLATFRDAERKKKDKKRLGKKARLRQWRKETFGDENGPQKMAEEIINDEATRRPNSDHLKQVDKGRRSRKRRGKGNSNIAES